MRWGLVVLAFVFVFAGCRRAPRQQPARPDAAAVTPVTAYDAARSACEDVQARFAATLAEAAGTCTTAADCGCYNPVAPGLGCGGVTDRATADALRAIENDFHAAKCHWPVQCAAWACEPRCATGRCAR